jgi:hypothetical protein
MTQQMNLYHVSDDKAVACPLPQGAQIFNIKEQEKKQLAM